MLGPPAIHPLEPLRPNLYARQPPPTPDPNNLLAAAVHPDSMSTFSVEVDGDVILEEWEATPGSTELQEIPGLEGLECSNLDILGVMEAGEYLGIVEVRTHAATVEVRRQFSEAP